MLHSHILLCIKPCSFFSVNYCHSSRGKSNMIIGHNIRLHNHSKCSALKIMSSDMEIKNVRGSIKILRHRLHRGLNNEGKTGSSDGVVGHGPSVPSHHTAAQLLLSSIVAASVDNSLSRGPSQRSQQTHRSSELFLLLWKRSGDIGHAVMALNSFCGPT